MTPDERVKQLEQELTVEREKIKNQNSYITKLEQSKGEKGNGLVEDPAFVAYWQSKMREDVTAKGLQEILTTVDAQTVETLKPELLAFLEANMTLDNTNVEYVVDAFSLVYGRALRNKDHAIHAAKKPSADDANKGTDSHREMLNKVNSLVDKTPMTEEDNSAFKDVPNPEIVPKSTKEAFKNWRSKFSG